MQEFKQLGKEKQPFFLSAREKEILQSAAVGVGNKDIMKKYHIREAKLKSHFRNILRKIDAIPHAG